MHSAVVLVVLAHVAVGAAHLNHNLVWLCITLAASGAASSTPIALQQVAEASHLTTQRLYIRSTRLVRGVDPERQLALKTTGRLGPVVFVLQGPTITAQVLWDVRCFIEPEVAVVAAAEGVELATSFFFVWQRLVAARWRSARGISCAGDGLVMRPPCFPWAQTKATVIFTASAGSCHALYHDCMEHRIPHTSRTSSQVPKECTCGSHKVTERARASVRGQIAAIALVTYGQVLVHHRSWCP